MFICLVFIKSANFYTQSSSQKEAHAPIRKILFRCIYLTFEKASTEFEKDCDFSRILDCNKLKLKKTCEYQQIRQTHFDRVCRAVLSLPDLTEGFWCRACLKSYPVTTLQTSQTAQTAPPNIPARLTRPSAACPLHRRLTRLQLVRRRRRRRPRKTTTNRRTCSTRWRLFR